MNTVVFLLLLGVGVSLFIAGLAMIYPPVAFLASGLALLKVAKEVGASG